MFGTQTLKGVQEKNVFVDQNGNEYKIVNSWITPKRQVERYVLIKKFDDNYWWLIRSLDIRWIDLN